MKIRQNEINIKEEDKKDINVLHKENMNNEKEINKTKKNEEGGENKIEKKEDENIIVKNGEDKKWNLKIFYSNNF